MGFYYCRPDLVHKERVGPRIKQEPEQGIIYEHSRADFFAADVNLALGEHKIQPYAGILLDRTNVKRTSLFSTPTHDDKLGTFGFSWSTLFKKLSLALEAARNFGRAKSSDDSAGSLFTPFIRDDGKADGAYQVEVSLTLSF